MQSVFSRAAQAHVCNCRPCVQAANTIIRRSATATTRRKATATEVFTACYTTILGTAAVADAHYKKKRRDDLDRRLDEAKNGLARLTDKSAARNVSGVDGLIHTPQLAIPEYSMGLLEAIKSICNQGARLAIFQDRISHRLDLLTNTHKTFAQGEVIRLKCILPSMTGVLDFGLVETALKLEEEQSLQIDSQHRVPPTSSHAPELEKMSDQLVDALITEVYRQDHPNDPEAMRRALESLDSVWTAIRLLRSDGYPRYIQPGKDVEPTQEARKELYRLNRDIFSAWDPSRAKFLVGKLSFNILKPPIPPTIHTYNALILGFTRVEQHTLAQIVIDSMLDKSTFHPTAQTIVCVLHHYRLTDNIFGFYDVIRRLVNLNFSQRMTTQDDRVQLDEGRRAGIWNVLDFPERPIEVMQRDHHVYEAMIRGLLHFDRAKDAAKVLVACMKEKCPVERHTLLRLIQYCLVTLDRAAIRILVRGILDNYEALVSILSAPDCPTKLPRLIQILFELVRVPSHLPLVRDSPKGLSLETQQNYLLLSTVVFRKETQRYLDLLSHIMRRAHLVLANANLSFLDAASKILRELRGMEVSMKLTEDEAARYDKMMLYHDVSKQLKNLPMQIRHHERRLVNILCTRLPSFSFMRKTLQREDIPLAIRLGWYHEYHDGLFTSNPSIIHLQVDVHDALTSSARLTDRFKSAAVRLFELGGKTLSIHTKQNFLDLPTEAIMEKLRAMPDSSIAESDEATASAPPGELTHFASNFVSRQQPAPSFISWQMNCT